MKATPTNHRFGGGTDDGDGADVADPALEDGGGIREVTERVPSDSDARGPRRPSDCLVSVSAGERPDRGQRRKRTPAPCYEEGYNRHLTQVPCYEEGTRRVSASPCYEEGNDRYDMLPTLHIRDGGVRRPRKRARSYSSSEGSSQYRRRRFKKLKRRRRRSRSKSVILQPGSKPFERESRDRDRSFGRYRPRTDKFYARSRSRSTKRRSRSITRVGSDEAAYARRVKTSNRTRYSSEHSDRRIHRDRRSRLLNPFAHKKRRTLAERDKRHYEQYSDSDELPYHNRKRRNTLSPRDCSRKRNKLRESHDQYDRNGTNAMLDKFLRIIKDVKGSSNSKLSLSNVVPEFDPMNKDQTILTWLTKVEECAEIYKWNDKETIHLALPKLSGIAKTWYTGLDTILYSWGEWKKKLVETFPYRDDYAELLTIMLAKKVRFGESLERYFYEKINLLNRCSIKGRKAVDCLLNGVEDRAVRVGAQAVQFREPEEVLKYFKSVKITTDRRERVKYDRRPFSPDSSHSKKSTLPRKLVCFNCNEEGHVAPKCHKQRTTCSTCSKVGHLSNYCEVVNKIQTKYRKENTSKETKDVSELTASGKSNEKYCIPNY